MADDALLIVHEAPEGRIVLVDSVTLCDQRLGPTDVLVAGSFAGALSFRFVLPFGPRAIIAHAAGVGKDRAGVSGLPLADRLGVAAVAVETMSARLGDARSVFEDGVIGHLNATAAALGLQEGMRVRGAATLLLGAPRGRPLAEEGIATRRRRVVVAGSHGGRVVTLDSMTFADEANRDDVLCAGSHGGRVNVHALLARIRPRGAIFNDGGLAKDRSGVDGLALLDEASVPGATVSADSARIGDASSTWETGVVSALNDTAHARDVRVGQTASEAARLMLARRRRLPGPRR